MNIIYHVDGVCVCVLCVVSVYVRIYELRSVCAQTSIEYRRRKYYHINMYTWIASKLEFVNSRKSQSWIQHSSFHFFQSIVCTTNITCIERKRWNETRNLNCSFSRWFCRTNFEWNLIFVMKWLHFIMVKHSQVFIFYLNKNLGVLLLF